MITIGNAAAGLVIQAAARDASAPLPPGVYLPSSGHLGHALMSAERFHPIPPGCPTDYVRPTTAPFAPLFFPRSEFQVVKRLVHLLLGEESEDAGVGQEAAEWIDLRVSSAGGVHEAEAHVDQQYRALAVAYFGPAQAKTSDPVGICREGLEWIAGASHTQHSKEFLALGVEEQIAMMNSISDERADNQRENAGTRLFTFLKTETIRAFYTSQAGLKELDFKGNAFYARSPGCESR